jgi:hypothetical protein
MNQRDIDAFEKCIELIKAGAPLENCVKQYPEMKPEMREMLETAMHVMSLREEQVPIESMNRSRIKLITQAKLLVTREKQNATVPGFSWLVRLSRWIIQGFSSLSPLAGRLVIVLGVTGLLILFSSGLAITSAKSLPGDSLYPVKRAVEDISIHLVPNGEVRSEYEDNYSKQRVVEVNRLIELKRIQRISFEGILESMGSSSWLVSGISVDISVDTIIVGGSEGIQSFKPGLVVEVEGITNPQGWVAANEIHLREYQFIGMVDKIDANYWQVEGIQLLITHATQIDVNIREGDDVSVLVRSEDNGLYALAILHDVHPTSIPFMPLQQLNTPTPSEESTFIIEEEHYFSGILDNINGNYWVVSGQIIFIVGETHIMDGINLGNSISVNYRIEANGSYTAIEINKYENEEHQEEYQSQDTPETGGESDTPGSIIVTPSSSDDEKEENPQTPDYHETPEPTENH